MKAWVKLGFEKLKYSCERMIGGSRLVELEVKDPGLPNGREDSGKGNVCGNATRMAEVTKK